MLTVAQVHTPTSSM